MKYVQQRPVAVISTKRAHIYSDNWNEFHELLRNTTYAICLPNSQTEGIK